MPAPPATSTQAPFWTSKTLAEMTRAEWESLCDGCGKCCVVRLEDEDLLPGRDHGQVYITDVACKLFDDGACRCTHYANRKAHVPDCVQLTPESVPGLYWLPETCAYRLVAEGRPLFDWHHLISGSRETVHAAGMSVRGQTVAEADIPEDVLPLRIVVWPGEPDVNTPV